MMLALGQFFNLSAEKHATDDEMQVDINNVAGSARSLLPPVDVTIKPKSGMMFMNAQLSEDAIIEILDGSGDVIYGAYKPSNSSVSRFTIPILESDDYTILITTPKASAEGVFSVVE